MSLKSLISTGTKVWLDSIEPTLVKQNRAMGATGATSNPIIIADIIKAGGFDEKIQKLADQGLDESAIAWQLNDQLVRDAQDVFMPVWEQTKGNDGYVSFEVDPLLEDAADPKILPHAARVKKYVELAKKWAGTHKNRMIKIPATDAGLAALEEVAAMGITINVTLIFSQRQYKTARDAVWKGAQKRKSGLAAFKSVYSIFVSRVDVYTEKYVPELSKDAQGKVGIVNVKKLWKMNQEFWKDKKCPLQQEIIFASTGKKMKWQSEDYYVAPLAGSDIQTNPPATNEFVEQSATQYTKQVDKMPADAIVKEIEQKVDEKKLESKLMEEGTAKFADPQKALQKLISEKRREPRRREMRTMKYAVLYFSVTLCLCGQSFLLGSPTTSPTSTQALDPIEKLIAQLSADEWQAREDAQEQLVALGASATARLKRVVAESPSEEARQRAEAAINRIGERQITGPSLITLHKTNTSLRDVFAEISRQSGSNLQPLPPELWDNHPPPNVSFDFENQPFWTVMRAIAEQTGMELKPWNNDGLYLIQGTPAAASAGRWTVTGPFLITLHRCARSQVIDYGANDAVNSDFAMTFTGVAEPKLRVLRASYLAKLDEAIDEHGNSLLAGDENDEANRRGGLDLAYTGNSSGQWQFTARLNYPRNMGTRLKTLRGSTTVQLQTRSETIEVPNILSAANVSRSVGGMSLTVRDVKKSADRYEVNVVVARDGGGKAGGMAVALDVGAIDWQRVQQSLADLKLVDDQGRTLERISFSSGGTDQSTEVMMSFSPTEAGGTRQRTGDPSKLVWRVATEVKDVVVPFEFKDVPLPQ